MVDVNGYYDMISGLADRNTATSVKIANDTNKFNAEEAKNNRDWQEEMSNTAHQREVEDLKKAGLNPVLSAGGQGASTGSGSSASGVKADVDMSTVQALTSIINTQMNNAAAIQAASISANATMAAASMAASATRYASDNSLNASRYGSDKTYEGNILTKGVDWKGLGFLYGQNMLGVPFNSSKGAKQTSSVFGNIWNSVKSMFK